MNDLPEDWREWYTANCREMIAKNGHMIQAVGANPGGGDPQFAYTIGLTPVCGFEFAISGLPIEDMHNALNALARKVQDEHMKPSDNLLVEGVFEPPCLPRLRPVDASHLDNFGWIKTVLGLPQMPPMWQAQYSTQDFKFPGDPGYHFDRTYQIDYSQPAAL
jgi:hypothetical protein